MKATHKSLILIAATGLWACDSTETARDPERLAEVAASGAAVMPFDLEATTHVFEKMDDGGLQQVVADSDDEEQVNLIRDHLRGLAERFSEGDFHDPEMIHGAGMPGLHDLVMGHERLTIQYDDIDAGAEIRYSSEDPQVVAALHAWFDAQVSDHGEHAQAHR